MDLPTLLSDLEPEPELPDNPFVEKDRRAREEEQRKRMLAKRNDPERVRARKMVEHAIRQGILFPGPCSWRLADGKICGMRPTEAHHEDYNDPLNVRWLCKRHHDKLTVRDVRRKHAGL